MTKKPDCPFDSRYAGLRSGHMLDDTHQAKYGVWMTFILCLVAFFSVLASAFVLAWMVG